jgi:hypothetical protein
MKSSKKFFPLLVSLFLVALTIPVSLWLVLRGGGEIRSKAAVSNSETICAKPGEYCRPCCYGAECVENRCVFKPTPTEKPIPVPTKTPCNERCNPTINPPVNCKEELICWTTSKRLGAWGVCRNPECPDSPDCICGISPKPTPTPTLEPTPPPFQSHN